MKWRNFLTQKLFKKLLYMLNPLNVYVIIKKQRLFSINVLILNFHFIIK